MIHTETRRIAGRTPADLNLMPTSEIAKSMAITDQSVRNLLCSAFRKMKAAGQLENFYALVQSAQVKAARAADEDVHPVLQCTSFECNPSAWSM